MEWRLSFQAQALDIQWPRKSRQAWKILYRLQSGGGASLASTEKCSSEPMVFHLVPARLLLRPLGRSEESFGESRGLECLGVRKPFRSVLQILWALGFDFFDLLEIPGAFSDSRA